MPKVKSPKPIAVLISDVHYNVHTLPLADNAMRQAIAKANNLGVPLIVAGDLHDTKANLRAECVNSMIETFKLAKEKPYVIVGNHDRINEKTPEHSLGFLRPFSLCADRPLTIAGSGLSLLPYCNSRSDFTTYCTDLPNSDIIICHQGIEGSNMGDYIQDKSAIKPEDVAGRRVISGHYHQRQTIQLPDGGKWDYVGNPYTLSFGEANDPEKGYQILYSDGSLVFVPTGLRKHVVCELDSRDEPWSRPRQGGLEDLIWVKLSGSGDDLRGLTKAKVAEQLGLTQPFRLDLIPDETETTQIEHKDTQSGPEVLDTLINSLTNTTDDRKERLKSLWKGLV